VNLYTAYVSQAANQESGAATTTTTAPASS